MTDRFEKQRNCILRNRKIATFILVVGLLCLALFLYGTIQNSNLGWFILFPLFVIFIAVAYMISVNRLLKQLSKIDPHKTCEMKLTNPKIGFLTTFEFTSASHASQKYYGIKIIGKQKFYYLFDKCYHYTAEDLKQIYAKFHGEISIQFYDGTRIVKMLQNDPYFLSIKY